eukprot:CAMPEP_0194370152 /NCGR_PEP_ID=MMETSP0174-20130528/18456_1 /TAXON_ID=216777 /ORGANISM="Proboscia alata, Strain PI-D3" /LENGTH=970 /DNA_ID=CAMNT_0039147453 /DNA_START=151 /DNA_END=3063 /DNA_ORIENTATION=-
MLSIASTLRIVCSCLILSDNEHSGVEAFFPSSSTATNAPHSNKPLLSTTKNSKGSFTKLSESLFDNFPKFSIGNNKSENDEPQGAAMIQQPLKFSTNFDPTPESLFSRSQYILTCDLGIEDANVLDDGFIWISPNLGSKVLSKTEYLAAGKFFALRSAFPDLNYRAHDFRIDEKDPFTIRLTTRTVGSMRGELRLRNEIIPPSGTSMRCPPESISMTFSPESGKLVKLCSGFAMDRLVGNTAGLCGVAGAAVTAGTPPSEWEIYPPSVVVQRFFGRPVKQLKDSSSFLAPFPESVMVQLTKGIILADMASSDSDLLSTKFTYCTPYEGPVRKKKYLESFSSAILGDGKPELTHFRVDPYDAYRVWVDIVPMFGNTKGAPQALSFTFDDDGFCTRITGGAVMDPSLGESGGLGGQAGLQYASGDSSPLAEFLSRPLPEVLSRLQKKITEPISKIAVDEFSLPKINPQLINEQMTATQSKNPKSPVQKLITKLDDNKEEDSSEKKSLFNSFGPISLPKPPKAARDPSPTKEITKSTTDSRKTDARETADAKKLLAREAAEAKKVQARDAAEAKQAQAREAADAKKMRLEEAAAAKSQAAAAKRAQAKEAAASKNARLDSNKSETGSAPLFSSIASSFSLPKLGTDSLPPSNNDNSKAAESATKKVQARVVAASAKAVAADAAAAKRAQAKEATAAKKAQAKKAVAAKAASKNIESDGNEKTSTPFFSSITTSFSFPKIAIETPSFTSEKSEASMKPIVDKKAEAREAFATAKQAKEEEEAARKQKARDAAEDAKRAKEKKVRKAQKERARKVEEVRSKAAAMVQAKADNAAERANDDAQRKIIFKRGEAKSSASLSRGGVKTKPSTTKRNLFGKFGGSGQTAFETTIARPKKPSEVKRVPAEKVVPKKMKAPKGVAILTKWKQNRDGSISGFIENSSSFGDGAKVTTSEIAKGEIAPGNLVFTSSGSRYFLS